MAVRSVGEYCRVICNQTAWAFNSDTTYTVWAMFEDADHFGCMFDILDADATKIVQFAVRSGYVGVFKYLGSHWVRKAYSINTRYFISVTMQGTAMKLRFNNAGEVSATGTRPTGNWAAATPPSMFSNFYGDNLIGTMRDFRYYNRILTDNEIETIYRSNGKDDIVYGLVNRYPLIGPTDKPLANINEIKNVTNTPVSITIDGDVDHLSFGPSFLESKVTN